MGDFPHSRTTPSARATARTALACAAAAVLIGVLLLVLAGARSAGLILAGTAGLALSGVGAWWVVAHHGPVRWLGAATVAGAAAVMAALLLHSGLWAYVLAAAGLWTTGLACAKAALRRERTGLAAAPAPAARHPVLIMNPRSGGGKVERFGLADKARALGAGVILLDTAHHQDVAALARRAVADGADLLGVAGGDGTQALVAEVAAAHGIPFVVLPAGTLNHFAMDLGLDRTDPSLALAALTHGVERRVDLGTVAGRPFVNTVSFGAYAAVVQSPGYRDAKAATALGALPDLLSGRTGTPFTATADGTPLDAGQALLVSNNPYASGGLLDTGRRPRLDTGRLGVRGVKVRGAADAAAMALRGEQSAGVSVTTAREVVVTGEAPTLPVAVDGEALSLPTPVVCTITPGALRVRVPATVPPAGPTHWHGLWRHVGVLALAGPAKH